MLEPLHISQNDGATLRKAGQANFNFDLLHNYFFLQNLIYLVDAFRYFERGNVFDEVFIVILKDCVVEHVVDEVVDEFDAILHFIDVYSYSCIYQLKFILKLHH